MQTLNQPPAAPVEARVSHTRAVQPASAPAAALPAGTGVAVESARTSAAAAVSARVPAAAAAADAVGTGPPRELGGPSGPEPTRYGDWERKGRCIDF